MSQAKRTLIYAHRGANKEAPENTRSAFDRALTYPIDGMETDVQLSRDEVPVLWHDRFLNKLGLLGRHIDDYDYAELEKMNFGRHFGRGAKREGITSLRDFLDAYRSRCRLLLEIKNRDWELVARHQNKVRQTLDMVGPGASSTIMVSSFDLDSLVYANQYRPGFPLVYNLEPEQGQADAEHALTKQPFLHGLCLHISRLNEPMVRLLRDHGKSVTVYTCNRDEDIRRALDLGVDILISDYPQKALSMRQG